ncbi:MAG: type II toxin-antitoxin system VapC family toxin [Actinobacteria bacterium]|nr:type II toxin-antitoxin system VapC family toxin [Actinomycetota bacterium]
MTSSGETPSTILLDTHVWIWALTTPDRLAAGALALFEDLDVRLLLSAASSWEIAIKFALGRLNLPGTPDVNLPAWMRLTGVEGLAIEHSHALRVATLPLHHRDPFDRLLVAQAQFERIPILTGDPHFSRYDVSVIPAA